MATVSVFSLILGSTSLVFLLAGWLMGKYPPTKINQLHGYRTTSSMKSQEHWDYAQKISNFEFLKAGVILLLLAPLGFFFNSGETLQTVFALVILVIVVLNAILQTEKKIKMKFEE
ncbi:MAG: SdpI family protein [Saprospiraceae bacterium]|nr:SdpI family protein [Saprospiraceae bacterium]